MTAGMRNIHRGLRAIVVSLSTAARGHASLGGRCVGAGLLVGLDQGCELVGAHDGDTELRSP